MNLRILLATALAASVLGCQTPGQTYDLPARIVGADDASRAALKAVVNRVMNTDVTLADSALTDSSVLTIERNPPRTMDNPNPLGRNMEMPVQLRLFLNGKDCVLVDQRDQSRYVLENTRCAAE